MDKGTIATAFKQVASKDREALFPLKATADAHSLPLRDFLSEQMDWLGGIQQCGVDECVKILASEGKTYLELALLASSALRAASSPAAFMAA